MTLLSVPDMNCGHCKAAVTTALSAVPDIGSVSVDLTTRQVEISGAANPEQLLIALLEVGFPAQVIAA